MTEYNQAVATLSQREVEILQEFANGNRNEIIAKKLYISLHTLKTHTAHIRAKLNASTMAEAVAIGIRRNIIE